MSRRAAPSDASGDPKDDPPEDTWGESPRERKRDPSWEVSKFTIPWGIACRRQPFLTRFQSSIPPHTPPYSGFAWLTRQLQLAAQAPSASFRNLRRMQRKLR